MPWLNYQKVRHLCTFNCGHLWLFTFVSIISCLPSGSTWWPGPKPKSVSCNKHKSGNVRFTISFFLDFCRYIFVVLKPATPHKASNVWFFSEKERYVRWLRIHLWSFPFRVSWFFSLPRSNSRPRAALWNGRVVGSVGAVFDWFFFRVFCFTHDTGKLKMKIWMFSMWICLLECFPCQEDPLRFVVRVLAKPMNVVKICSMNQYRFAIFT